MELIESTKYKLPDSSRHLPKNPRPLARPDIRNDLVEGDPGVMFSSLEPLMGELGFCEDKKFRDRVSRKGRWRIWTRVVDIPNFPEGETRVNSFLAYYKPDKIATAPRVLLRQSLSSLDEEEISKDLAEFTRHFVERPTLRRLPNTALANQRGFQYAESAALGALVGGVVQALRGRGVSEGRNPSVARGVLIGGIAFPVITGALHYMGERSARSRIPRIDQYQAGEYVWDALVAEFRHRLTVSIQQDDFRRDWINRAEFKGLPPEDLAVKYLENYYGVDGQKK
ncbi:MAG: hypothetical protein ACD_38C00154G0003 [uncultured bacterium]|uniref:Uncharacterized protein n=1 Tax=Candidatus Daviesbacteria bacterium GW2011_GWC2_40_12 TaxID=1618431 RepID=A0A0G0T5J2_9BACT|nr:MAG: hypothetical protein ACD_38C00154G0003 [uncultured bacterium]KKQ85507.1 MAG: hypothetical protein UT04_C0003G0012 [Candidatus Daviesbacteria bacterium GW2011_GWF2_38_7]KKR16813.1 MAG: hypothetical protein UT45_C0004G0144 [Candidatus Daviesbacteria bacterium GW2011_GWA2_39_33]KKR24474.1 MAG: hypothetical protein UT54_C0019G0017 [Candidatus Daviesbacteria bacterium GW2011_GWB1_39_5]KKR42405.1 MAG: hypothetical protein UT77_C0002G0058 [Candidatus Daviesbacteria bacterium GW2011_GWC2_40_12]